ncbi:MAG: hypothetical protein SFZ03_02710 [Candidatus Melainabacteria bacterium]|nr:hypothetical protein [Candidatus Melainabacteria bacterium]
MFLIIGGSNSLTNRLYAKLRARGHRSCFWPSDSFPLESWVALETGPPPKGRFWLPGIGQQSLSLQEIEGVYWWFYEGPALLKAPPVEGETPEQAARRQRQELDACLLTAYHLMDCPWINPPGSVLNHRYKVEQLTEATALGFTIPDSLMSNDPQAIAAFYQDCQGEVVVKSVATTGVPSRLTQAQLSQWQKNGESKPATRLFQRFIPGTDVRVHVVGQRLFASEVLSDHWVSKVDLKDPQPVSIPDALAQQCLTLCEKLNLVLAGIDFRKTSDGEYVFLEANPSPQYPAYEDRNHYPISDAIVEALIRGVGAKHR